MRVKNNGFTLVEVMVTMALLGIVVTAGSMVFVSGQNLWGVVDTQIHIQQSFRQSVNRLVMELQESGHDSLGVFQVSEVNNGGFNSSDILRFSVPICVCGMSVIDDDANVNFWGAPLNWGRAGCDQEYTIEINGKVNICHLPPGNPANEQSISVSPNAINAHLAHGDRIGECSDCDPTAYTNRIVEYSLQSGGILVRRVLDSGLNEINSTMMGQYFTDFRVSINGDESIVQISATLYKEGLGNHTVSDNIVKRVFLRN